MRKSHRRGFCPRYVARNSSKRCAVGVALTTQCPYCNEIHPERAKKADATEGELAETTLVAAAFRAGGAMTHGTHTLD